MPRTFGWKSLGRDLIASTLPDRGWDSCRTAGTSRGLPVAVSPQPAGAGWDEPLTWHVSQARNVVWKLANAGALSAFVCGRGLWQPDVVQPLKVSGWYHCSMRG